MGTHKRFDAVPVKPIPGKILWNEDGGKPIGGDREPTNRRERRALASIARRKGSSRKAAGRQTEDTQDA
jgi:hypothetical protein